jgi:hypothetical protein
LNVAKTYFYVANIFWDVAKCPVETFPSDVRALARPFSIHILFGHAKLTSYFLVTIPQWLNSEKLKRLLNVAIDVTGEGKEQFES